MPRPLLFKTSTVLVKRPAPEQPPRLGLLPLVEPTALKGSAWGVMGISDFPVSEYGLASLGGFKARQ